MYLFPDKATKCVSHAMTGTISENDKMKYDEKANANFIVIGDIPISLDVHVKWVQDSSM